MRQSLLRVMIEELGYPKSLIGVEKDLFLLPHLQDKKKERVKRRADILCFAKDLHPTYPIYPLLLIECKAFSFTEEVIRQVLGYNHFVQAYFVAIANPDEFLLFVQKENDIEKIPYLPPYEQLIRAAQK
ncbi:MAG: type I restriction enzyme HsdR N-terminal domain-containing protein [Chlamydiota bacterium]